MGEPQDDGYFRVQRYRADNADESGKRITSYSTT